MPSAWERRSLVTVTGIRTGIIDSCVGNATIECYYEVTLTSTDDHSSVEWRLLRRLEDFKRLCVVLRHEGHDLGDVKPSQSWFPTFMSMWRERRGVRFCPMTFCNSLLHLAADASSSIAAQFLELQRASILHQQAAKVRAASLLQAFARRELMRREQALMAASIVKGASGRATVSILRTAIAASLASALAGLRLTPTCTGGHMAHVLSHGGVLEQLEMSKQVSVDGAVRVHRRLSPTALLEALEALHEQSTEDDEDDNRCMHIPAPMLRGCARLRATMAGGDAVDEHARRSLPFADACVELLRSCTDF